MTKQKEFELRLLEKGIIESYKRVHDEYNNLFSCNVDYVKGKKDVRIYKLKKEIEDMPLHQFASYLHADIELMKYCAVINTKHELYAEYWQGELAQMRKALLVLKKETEIFLNDLYKYSHADRS